MVFIESQIHKYDIDDDSKDRIGVNDTNEYDDDSHDNWCVGNTSYDVLSSEHFTVVYFYLFTSLP